MNDLKLKAAKIAKDTTEKITEEIAKKIVARSNANADMRQADYVEEIADLMDLVEHYGKVALLMHREDTRDRILIDYSDKDVLKQQEFMGEIGAGLCSTDEKTLRLQKVMSAAEKAAAEAIGEIAVRAQGPEIIPKPIRKKPARKAQKAENNE